MINIILILLWVGYIIFWIASAKGTKKTEYHKKVMVGGMIARIILISIIISLWIVSIFSRAVFSPNLTVQIFGLFILISGLAFAIWARQALGTNWSANPIEIKKEHNLVTSGPYRWVRHPIYTGVIFALLGTFLTDGRLRVLILFILVTIGMIIRIKLEDRLMAQKFPEEYPEYKKKVKSLIPGIL